MAYDSGRATLPYLTPLISSLRLTHPCLAGAQLQHAGPLHWQAGGATRAATSMNWSCLPYGRHAEPLAITSTVEQSTSGPTM